MTRDFTSFCARLLFGSHLSFLYLLLKFATKELVSRNSQLTCYYTYLFTKPFQWYFDICLFCIRIKTHSPRFHPVWYRLMFLKLWVFLSNASIRVQCSLLSLVVWDCDREHCGQYITNLTTHSCVTVLPLKLDWHCCWILLCKFKNTFNNQYLHVYKCKVMLWFV